ncbi:hypothetical protein ABVK25_007297 [Lepraria finkii]|uniref:Uncharacterized protein n=1 Tax=Lepraria finkii TaxID=1340010 RepID=A0ABR4B498_9LECA
MHLPNPPPPYILTEIQNHPLPLQNLPLRPPNPPGLPPLPPPVDIGPIEPNPTNAAPPPLTSSQSHSTKYKIRASVLLSRPPS